MIFPTGNKAIRRSAELRSAGFTLIELILVMAMLLIVLSLTAPSLAVFFRGRALDSEARRFMTLTHYGQSRAVLHHNLSMPELDARFRFRNVGHSRRG